jgi:hypothetical protein
MKNIAILFIAVFCLFQCSTNQDQSKRGSGIDSNRYLPCQNLDSIELFSLALDFVQHEAESGLNYNMNVIVVNDSIRRINMWPKDAALGGNFEIEFNVGNCVFTWISRGK